MSQRTLQKLISRLMALLLSVLLFAPFIPVARADGESGTCGGNLSWVLSDGTLTITGSGAMQNYSESQMAPWHNVRSEIIRLSLPDSLTSIGDLAFYDCYRLTAVDIPDSVTEIGGLAFASCERLELLDLGEGLRTIKADAFHGCRSLKNLRLPQSLSAIGNQAFYDCASITSVVVPSGVMSLGSTAFAYCTSLVRAEIQTPITVLPDGIFFGCSQLSTLILPSSVGGMGNSALHDCSSLNTVSYGGSNISPSDLKTEISNDVPGFNSTGNVTNELPGSTSVSGTATENPDGTVTEQITTVTNNENSSVSSTIDRTFQTEGDDTVTSDITVSIENDDGWQDAISDVESALGDLGDRLQPGTSVGTANITVYIKDSETVDEEFLESLAGQNVIVTVVTKDGSSWKIDCATLIDQELTGAYDLRYTLEPVDQEFLERMGASQGYRIRFAESAEVQAEAMIQLPDNTIRQTATLFQLDKKELVRIQSAVVDRDGYAHFYLGSVDRKTEYYLGINVPEAKSEAIIPENMYDEYTLVDHSTGKQYVITGRKSSWNMGLGKVMAILAVVMVSAIVVVGAVMFFWNKQRLKAGYVPQWDDEEENT